MSEPPEDSASSEGRFHTYVTHHIPWYVRMFWVGLWVGMIWYIVKFAIPSAKNYF